MRAQARRRFGFTKAELAAALGLTLISGGAVLPGAVCGTSVANTRDGMRGFAQALLVRARKPHDHDDVEALAAVLRKLAP